VIFPGAKIPDGSSPEAIYAKRLEQVARTQYQHNQVSGAKVNRTTQGDFMAPQTSGASGGASVSIKQYALIDVQDDYLICLNPPKVPNSSFGSPLFLGSFGDDRLSGADVVLNTGDPNYSPDKNDAYWNTTHKRWKIFDGVNWVNMTAPTGSKVYVAKEPLHRTSLVAKFSLAEQHTYEYSDPTDPDGPAFEHWTIGSSGRFNLLRKNLNLGRGAAFEWERLVPVWTDSELILAITAKTGVRRQVFKDNGADVQDGDGNVIFKLPGDPVLDGDGNPTFASVTLMVYGRSSQWAGPAI